MKKINKLKDEKGSFTVEATVISVIVILVVICLMVYSFLLYDKNKVSSVMNETLCYVNENREISNDEINNHIRNDLNGKLYTSNISSISSNLDSNGKLKMEVNIKTNSKIYELANVLMKKKYTISFTCNGNCADIADKVREQ